MVVGSGALLAAFFLKTLAEKIWVAPLVHETENIKRLVFDLIIEEVGKRATAAAWKSMRSDVVPALPLDHDSYRVLNPLVEIVAKAR